MINDPMTVPWQRLWLPLLSFAVTFAALLGLWPLVGGAYGGAFRAVTHRMFLKCGPDARVQVGAGSEAGMDVKFHLYNRRQAGPDRSTKAYPVKVGSRYVGYLPAVFYLSLAAATLAMNRRRWRALVVGLFAVQGLVLLHLLVIIHQTRSLSITSPATSVRR